MELIWITIILQLVFLEGVLSIDNAAVLGAMVAHLPRDCGVPWPRVLRRIGRRLDPLLGPQQQAALKVGLLGAYFGRGLMLVLAHVVIQNPWLRLVGGVYLVYLAIDHLAEREPVAKDEEIGRVTGRDFWRVVLAVELADLAFSLDNVVAAVALSDHVVVVMLGVAVGILTMRVAAGLFASLVQCEPVLEPTAYVLVLIIGALLIGEELFHFEVPALLQFGLSVSTLALALLYAHWTALRAILHPPLVMTRSGLSLARRTSERIVIRPAAALTTVLLTLFRES